MQFHLVENAKSSAQQLRDIYKQLPKSKQRVAVYESCRLLELLADTLQANMLMLQEALAEKQPGTELTPPVKAALSALGAMQHIRDGGELTKAEIQTFVDSLEGVLQPILSGTTSAKQQLEQERDGEYFRWLTADHTLFSTRSRRDEVLHRLPVLSTSAARTAVSLAIHQSSMAHAIETKLQEKAGATKSL